MPARPRPLPPALGDVFTPAQARSAGVSEGRLRAKDLAAPFMGVRVVTTAREETVDDDPLAYDRAERARIRALIDAYVPLMPPHAFIAGRSALVWHGASVAHGVELEVGVPEPRRPPRRRGIRARSVAPHLVHVRSYGPLRIASPASAWAMLAHVLDVRELVRIGDQLVRVPRDVNAVPLPEQRLATIGQLRAACDAGRRRGAGNLREALDLIRVGSGSPLETDLRLDLSAAHLPEPELDVEIRDGAGRLIGVADAVYRRHRVILEVEGDHHRTSAAQWARDLQKHAGYTAEGWHLVRLTWQHIRGRYPAAVDMVRAALARHPPAA